MDEEDKVNLDTSTQDGELDTTQDGDDNTDSNEADEGSEDIEALKKKAALADNYKIRAEKAEALAKKAKAPQTVDQKSTNLSQNDMLAILRAEIQDEDLAEVQDYASLKKISISEALKSPIVKAILSEKEEFRKTAQATASGVTKRGTTKVTDEVMLSKADKGELPDSAEDIAKLWRLRKGLKK